MYCKRRTLLHSFSFQKIPSHRALDSQTSSASVSNISDLSNHKSASSLYPFHCTKYCLPCPHSYLSKILSMKYFIVPFGVTMGPGLSIRLPGNSLSSFSTCRFSRDMWKVVKCDDGGGNASLYVEDCGKASRILYGLSNHGINFATLPLFFCMYSRLQ